MRTYKDADEVKSLNIHIRVTHNENDMIANNAKMEGMNVSDYLLKHAKCKVVSPEVIIMITDVLDVAKDICRKNGDDNMNEYIDKEIEKIWSLLNS